MPLLNYTSEVDADKTAMQIAKILSTHGASAVMTEFDPTEGFVVALSFKIKINNHELAFRLPTDWKPVFTILTKGKKKPPEWHTGPRSLARWEATYKQQAVKTAWRIIKDWVEAQCALIESQMVTTAQVFLPYAIMRDGKTLGEKVAADPQFLLGDGK